MNNNYENWSNLRKDIKNLNQWIHPDTASSYTINPNVEYFLNNITQRTTFTLGSITNNNIVNEYKFSFYMNGNYTISGLSSSIIWANDTPSFEKHYYYEISIKAIPSAWSNGVPSSYNYFGICSKTQ